MYDITCYVREISCRYCKIYHYLVLCKAEGYMIESHTTHSSLRDVLKMHLSTFSGRLSENCGYI